MGRDALTGGHVPLGDDEAFPRAEFASSTTGTLLIRVWNYRGEQPKPRPATEADRLAYPSTFSNFIATCLAGAGKDPWEDASPRRRRSRQPSR
jgi:hypothetical protein